MIEFLFGVLTGAGVGFGAYAWLRTRPGDGRHRMMTEKELRQAEINAGLRPREYTTADGRVFTRDPETGKIDWLGD